MLNNEDYTEIEKTYLEVLRRVEIPLSFSELTEESLRINEDLRKLNLTIASILDLCDEGKVEDIKRKFQISGIEKDQDREDLKNGIEKLKNIQFDIEKENVRKFKERIFQILREIQLQ